MNECEELRERECTGTREHTRARASSFPPVPAKSTEVRGAACWPSNSPVSRVRGRSELKARNMQQNPEDENSRPRDSRVDRASWFWVQIPALPLPEPGELPEPRWGSLSSAGESW